MSGRNFYFQTRNRVVVMRLLSYSIGKLTPLGLMNRVDWRPANRVDVWLIRVGFQSSPVYHYLRYRSLHNGRRLRIYGDLGLRRTIHWCLLYVFGNVGLLLGKRMSKPTENIAFGLVSGFIVGELLWHLWLEPWLY